jgi:acetyl esterase/lipase
MPTPSRCATSFAALLTVAVVAACAQPPAASAPAEPAPAALQACPVAPRPQPPANAGGTGGGPPSIPTAGTIAPSDTSTSVVLDGLDGPQIQCGRVPLDTRSDIVFASPTGPDGARLDLALDLLVPADGADHPLVVYVTGGGFASAERTNGLDLRTHLAEAGYAVASVRYRTATDGATYVDGVADVKSAVRFLRAGAAEYRIDPDRVAVWGESAGGYLAAMVGTTNGDPRFEAGEHLGTSSDVQAVVDKFGASDVPRIADDFDAAMQAFYANPNGPVARYTASVDPAAADPLDQVDPTDPPFLLLHGTADTIVSPSQTLILHDALLGAGVDSTRLVLVDAGHGDLAFLGDAQAGLPWSTVEVMDRTVDWLDEHLRP